MKQLVELHGGTIRAKSPGKNKGATFTAVLPLTVVHSEAEPMSSRRHPTADPVAPALESWPQIAGVRVLVVDDEPDARALLRRLFEERDGVVSTASSASEAVAAVQGGVPLAAMSADDCISSRTPLRAAQRGRSRYRRNSVPVSRMSIVPASITFS